MGVQVTDSFCRCLKDFPQHHFVVVLTDSFSRTVEDLKQVNNVSTVQYLITNSLETLFFGRDQFLDSLIKKYKIDGVLSMFAPTRWNPKVPHLAGFALAQLVIPESPFYRIMNLKEMIKQRVRNAIWTHYFHTGTHYLYTENPFITERLKKKWKDFQVITVTNYYNQVFDNPDRWIEKKLPDFDGTTILTLSRNNKHKYITILPKVSRILQEMHPDFKFRFVLPETEDNFAIEEDVKQHFCLIGVLPVETCPSVYSQCDLAFQPILLECFTATFPESMRMRKPIIACNLDFAKGLCGNAALYFDWDKPEQAADLIYKVATLPDVSHRMIEEGSNQLANFDNYDERARKLISALEILIKKKTLY